MPARASSHRRSWPRPILRLAICVALGAVYGGVLPGTGFGLPAADLETEYRAYEKARAAGDIPTALVHARAALDLGLARYGPDHQRTAILYNNLAGLYSRGGDFPRAEDYYGRALKIYLAREGETGPGVATVLNNLGRVCEKSDRLVCARGRYSRAVEITRKNKGETHPLLALRYNNLAGVLLREGRVPRALGLYRKALTINIERLGRDHPRTAKVQANLAGAYRASGDLNKAARYYRSALENGRRRLGADHPEVALRGANLGGVLRQRGDLVGALKQYRQAATAFERGGMRAEFLDTLGNMALAQSEVPNYEHAAETLRRGINAVLSYRLEIGRGKGDFTRRHIGLFDRLFLLALREGRTEEAFTADMLKRGLSIAEGLALPAALERGGVPEDLRQPFLDNRRRLGRLRSRRAALLNAGRLDEAAAVLERMLARERRQAELETLLLRDYPNYAFYRRPFIPRPDEIRARLKSDEILISYNFSQPRAMAFVLGKAAGLAALPLGDDGRARSAEIAGRILNLHALLAGDAEDGSRMCPCFRLRLSDGSLRYWNRALEPPPWSDSGRYVQSAGIVYREDSSGRREKVGRIEGDYFDGDEVPKLRRELLRSLHRDLIAPVMARFPRARRMVIVPDRSAYYLPFGLLIGPDGKILLESRELKLVHSPVVWHRLRTGKPAQAKLPVFGVGNAVYAADHQELRGAALAPVTRDPAARLAVPRGSLEAAEWSNLPGTREELETITRLAYPGADANGVREHTLFGAGADREEFLKLNRNGRLSRYRILHFSLHGLFVDGNPDLNALVFSDPRLLARLSRGEGEDRKDRRDRGDRARPGADPTRTGADRFLRLGDVKTLRLDSNLVVMSACETSLGRSAPGEGMVGLPQAFLIAGSRNVLATLWAVDDTATRELMRYFYGYLLRDRFAPAEALRRAQLKIRETRPDPFYWAAFALFGD